MLLLYFIVFLLLSGCNYVETDQGEIKSNLQYLQCDNDIVISQQDCIIILNPIPPSEEYEINLAKNDIACTQQRGLCLKGSCILWDGKCLESSINSCTDDLDCDDHNPCTFDDCPEPKCGPCHHNNVPNGTSCMNDMICMNGICCL